MIQIPLLGIDPTNLNKVVERYLYTHVYSSIIHSSQNVETCQMFTDEWMDTQNVVYIYIGIYIYIHYDILLSLNKEGNSNMCYNMGMDDEP